jgi:hypothetical protein
MTDQELIEIALKSRKITKCAPGKYVKSSKPWHAGYQLSTPKGITLHVRKTAQRWAVR